MKNILAENLLRFGAKNLSKSARLNLNKLNEDVKIGNPVTINYKQIVNFQPGKLATAADIQSIFKGVFAELQKNPETAAMLNSKSISLKSARFIGSSSNYWNQQIGKTAFNRTADGKVIAANEQQGSMEGYNLNLKLANDRANSCQAQLIKLLQQQGVLVNTATLNPTTAALVYDTGGKLDTTKQYLQVQLQFNYISPNDIISTNTIKPQFILTGTYTANGLSSTKTSDLKQQDLNSYRTSTDLLTPAMKNDPNRLCAFEVKWNPNVLATAWKKPWYRWLFIYNQQGKIVRIKGIVYDPELNQQLQNYFKNGDIPLNDPTMIYMMNLNDPGYYDKHIKPYI